MQNAAPFRHQWFGRVRHLSSASIRRIPHRSTDITVDTSQPTEPDKDGAKSLRPRRYGNKSLPLPPIIDPKAIASRQRYKLPKSRRYEGGKSDLQRALHENVYAQALSTPIRQCSLTKAQLPSHFMAAFVGRIDMPSAPESAEDGHSQRITAHLLPQGRELKSEEYEISPRAIYISNSYTTVARLSKRTDSKSMKVDAGMTEWYAKKAGRAVRGDRNSKDWSWPKDNADKVLDVLREEVSYRLKRVMRTTPIATTVDAVLNESADKPVCFLKLDNDATVMRTMRRVPTFDLTALLDTESLHAVMEKQTTWGNSSWIAVHKYDHAVGLMLALLRLEQYTLPLRG